MPTADPNVLDLGRGEWCYKPHDCGWTWNSILHFETKPDPGSENSREVANAAEKFCHVRYLRVSGVEIWGGGPKRSEGVHDLRDGSLESEIMKFSVGGLGCEIELEDWVEGGETSVQEVDKVSVFLCRLDLRHAYRASWHHRPLCVRTRAHDNPFVCARARSFFQFD